MSRAPLIAAAAIAALWLAPLELAAQRRSAPAELDPHIDPGVVTAGCGGCHRGHGQSRSPMLGAAQKEVCLSCHGTAGQAEGQVAREALAPGVRPTLMAPVLAKPFTHRLDARVFSRREPGVTCTSCHSPHRSMPPRPGSGPSGIRKLSPKDPHRLEYELCVACHGSRGPGLVDVGRLIEPHNRSYHPVRMAALDRSPSVLPSLSGREVNCTDCHGNSGRSGPRGPHGSDVRHLLRYRYTTVDGSAGPGEAYALCFSCHRSKELMSEPSPFPLHQLHVVDQRTACATCHNPHGSVMNRGLIRYQATGTVAPSASGLLLFSSTSPGRGKCYLTCHGRNHDPELYGFDLDEKALSGLGARD